MTPYNNSQSGPVDYNQFAQQFLTQYGRMPSGADYQQYIANGGSSAPALNPISQPQTSQPAAPPAGAYGGSPYGGSSAYDQLYGGIIGNTGVGGFKWDANNTQSKLDQYGTDFTQQFQNEVGRAPTTDEINKFYEQAVKPVGATSSGFYGTDPNQVVQQYLPQAYGKDITSYQDQQALDQSQKLGALENQQLQDNLKTLQGTIPSMNDAMMKQFLEGNGMKELQGSLNNSGLLDSGAFNSALASTMGSGMSGILANAIGGLVNPALSQIQGNPQQAYGAGNANTAAIQNLGLGAGNSIGTNNQNMYDFDLQSALAEKLAAEGNPSGAQNALGMASGGIGAAGSLLQGAGAAKSLTWICTAMNAVGTISRDEIHELHDHLYKALYRRPFKFLSYWMFGKLLVLLANRVQTNWNVWKSDFYYDVMAEKDPAKAVDLYADAFWRLFSIVRDRLKARLEVA